MKRKAQPAQFSAKYQMVLGLKVSCQTSSVDYATVERCALNKYGETLHYGAANNDEGNK